MRRTTQFPAGGVQSSLPSVRHLRRKVDHVRLAHRLRHQHGRRRHGVDARRGREPGLLLESVDDRGVQDELGDLRAGRRGRCLGPLSAALPAADTARAAAVLGRLRWRGEDGDAEDAGGDRGERDGARAARNRDHGAERSPVVAHLELSGDAAPAARAAAAAAARDEGQAADGLRLRELVLDPRPFVCRGGWQQRGLREVAVGEGGHLERAATRGHLHLHRAHRTIASRSAIRDNGRVRIELGRLRLTPDLAAEPASSAGLVLIGAGRRRRLGQGAGERASAFDARLAPHVLLHRLGGRHPRAAALTPPRRARDGHFETQLVGQRGGVPESVLPLRRHEDQPLLDDLRCVQAGIEVLEASDARALHPLEVGLDAVLGDVPAHPVPPDARLGTVGRALEAAKQGVALRLLRHNRVGAQHDNDGICRPAQQELAGHSHAFLPWLTTSRPRGHATRPAPHRRSTDGSSS